MADGHKMFSTILLMLLSSPLALFTSVFISMITGINGPLLLITTYVIIALLFGLINWKIYERFGKKVYIFIALIFIFEMAFCFYIINITH